MLYLMKVPLEFAARVATGSAYVDGSVVKDVVSHQVLSHLQPARLLTEAIMSGPLAVPTLVSSVAANAQLIQIKSMLETLQTIATIGAATSVLNLGVSIGGFAMVLSALKKVDEKLDGVHAAIKTVDRKLDARFFAEMIVVLRRAEGGFDLSPSDRRHRWLETEDRTDTVIEHVLERLKTTGISLEARAGSDDGRRETWALLADPETIQMLGCLLSLVSARTEALLCLQRPAEAAEVSRRAARWLVPLPTNAKAFAVARVGGMSLPPTQLARVAMEAKALTTWVSSGQAVAAERAQMYDALNTLGVDTESYVLQVRNHPAPELLMLPYSSDIAS